MTATPPPPVRWVSYPGLVGHADDFTRIGEIKGPTIHEEYLTVVAEEDGRLGYAYGPRCCMCWGVLPVTARKWRPPFADTRMKHDVCPTE